MKRRDFITLIGGAAAGLFREAWAQEAGRIYRLGVLAQAPRNTAHWIAFFDELRKHAFVEGTNLSIVDGFNAQLDRADNMAVEVVNARPDVIQTAGALTKAVQQATQTIPILTVSDDLLAEQAVASLSHPGGNTTGISILATELDSKRQDILVEAVPAAHHLALLVDAGVTKPQQLKQLEDAAKARGLIASSHLATKSEDVIPAIAAAVAAGAQILNVLASSLFNRHRAQIIEHTALARLPAMYQWPEMAEEGGLIAYGPRFVALYRQHALQTIKVLNGTRPADIPVEQPTKFELVINLKTAKSLGLTIPPSVLVRADEVIE
jgi:putative ABC transport system substrate-binding protein